MSLNALILPDGTLAITANTPTSEYALAMWLAQRGVGQRPPISVKGQKGLFLLDGDPTRHPTTDPASSAACTPVSGARIGTVDAQRYHNGQRRPYHPHPHPHVWDQVEVQTSSGQAADDGELRRRCDEIRNERDNLQSQLTKLRSDYNEQLGKAEALRVELFLLKTTNPAPAIDTESRVELIDTESKVELIDTIDGLDEEVRDLTSQLNEAISEKTRLTNENIRLKRVVENLEKNASPEIEEGLRRRIDDLIAINRQLRCEIKHRPVPDPTVDRLNDFACRQTGGTI